MRACGTVFVKELFYNVVLEILWFKLPVSLSHQEQDLKKKLSKVENILGHRHYFRFEIYI